MTTIAALSRYGPAACLFFSCLAHILVLFFVVGPSIDMVMEREKMVLELKEQQNRDKASPEQQRKKEVSLRLARQASGENPSSAESPSEKKSGNLPEHVDFAPERDAEEQIPAKMDDERKERTLRQVRQSIASAWREADPPYPGIAELRLKLSPSGELMSIWITRLKGRSELGEYLRSLLGQAAPYSRAMLNATQPVVFDCRFEISGERRDRGETARAR